MIHPDHVTTADATIAMLVRFTPWLADKVGSAAITQSVRETWERVKTKLQTTTEGSEALVKLTSEPATSIESLRNPLQSAIESDPDFASDLRRLVVTGSDNQVAYGTNNKQAKVDRSENATISIS